MSTTVRVGASAVGTDGVSGRRNRRRRTLPDPICGDTTDFVTVCVADALRHGCAACRCRLPELAAGTGSVDGKNGSGYVRGPHRYDGLLDRQGRDLEFWLRRLQVPTTASWTLNAAGQTTGGYCGPDRDPAGLAEYRFGTVRRALCSDMVTTRTADGTLVPGAVITGTRIGFGR